MGLCFIFHLEERDHQIEDQPHIHHLDVRRLGKVLRDRDEHGRQDEQHRQVDRDDGLEEEGLEVVGHVRDDDEEQGGDVNSEDGAQQPPDEELIRLFEKNSRPAKRCLLLFSPKVCPGYLNEKTNGSVLF